MDRQTDMTKLLDKFYNFPKNSKDTFDQFIL